MKTFQRSMRAAAMLLGLATLSSAQSAGIKLPAEGWVSWQVAAVDNAPAWCCFDGWRGRNASRTACRLDDGPDSFGTSNDEVPTDAVKIYARVAGGKLDRLQALAASCPVKTGTQIQEFADVTVDDSARWLAAQAKDGGIDARKHRSMGEHALAALAMHRGGVAGGALAGFARDPHLEMRKSAVFWLAMLRGSEGAQVASSVMFSDQEAEVRKHAAFAISQTQSPIAVANLIRLGNTDKVGEVRAQAWFWLAQTGAAEAEQAIAAALRKDADDDVREQAIFALSQLPDERATRALIAAAEDKSLSREQRKRAVFWLSQSQASAAQAYLEKLLARPVSAL